jgi:hypothetical protein
MRGCLRAEASLNCATSSAFSFEFEALWRFGSLLLGRWTLRLF